MVTSETLKAFGTELRAARVAAGWTLAKLAEEAFGNPDRKGFVSQIENGRKQITPLTVGKLAEALDLEDAITRPMLANDLPEQEAYSEQDQRAEKLLVAAEKEGAPGVAEGLLIALAYEYAEGETTDLDSAYRGLKVALETAREMAARAALPDNTDAGLSAVRAEVQRLNAAEDVEGAGVAIEDAIARQAAGMAALLDLGVQQDRLRNDPVAAAKKLVQQVDMEGVENRTRALWAVWLQWKNRGRDAGLAFELLVSIELAEELLNRAASPDQHGAALNGRGIALKTLGEREAGTARLEEAVKAYRDALKKYSRDRVPLYWAMTQNNLGNALHALGEREAGTELLEMAVTAYREALKEYSRDRVPLDWAMTQNNLGNALQTLGQREAGTTRLEEAVTAYRNALKEHTRHRVPLDWAMTQNNLGNALRILGEGEAGTERLEEAVDAYRDALKEYTRDRVPLNWAATQNNLGIVLRILGEGEASTERLEEAVDAYHDALKEWTLDRVPLDWAMTQGNLANLEMVFFDKNGDLAHVDAAERYVRGALEVFEAAGASQYVMMAEEMLVRIAGKRVG